MNCIKIFMFACSLYSSHNTHYSPISSGFFILILSAGVLYSLPQFIDGVLAFWGKKWGKNGVYWQAVPLFTVRRKASTIKGRRQVFNLSGGPLAILHRYRSWYQWP